MLTNININGNPEDIITQNLGLVKKAVRRYRSWIQFTSGLDENDLFQVGCMGLMRAYEIYDPTKGNVSFSNYAFRRICTAINRYMYDFNPTLSFPRVAKETYWKIYKANLLEQSPEEIGRKLGLTEYNVLLALEYARYKLTSTDIIVHNEKDGEETTLGNFIEYYDDFNSSLTIMDIMNLLSDTQKKIFHYHFVEEISQSEVSEIVNMSQPHVSRIIKKIKGIIECYINRANELNVS